MLTELRTLLAVVRHGTFSRAGEHVGLTQTAITGQMKRLEESLGFALFDRTGRSARPNAAAFRVVAQAETILGMVDRLGDALGHDQNERLTIAAIASTHANLLVRALISLRERHPTAHIQAFSGVSQKLLGQLEAGEADVAIMVHPVRELTQEFVWQTVSRDPFVLIAPAELQHMSWSEVLATQTLLGPDRRSYGGQRADAFLRRLPFKVRESAEIPARCLVPLVQSGFGVGLMPFAADKPLPDGICAISLEDEVFYRELGIARLRRALPDRLIDDFIECLMNGHG